MCNRVKKRKFKKGDVIYSIREPWLGKGIVKSINVDETLLYLGKNEWLTEYVTYAIVAYQNSDKACKLQDIVNAKQVELYNSLKPGDLIFHGKKKNVCGVVIATLDKRHDLRSVATQSVWVLENFTKRLLSIRSMIIDVRRNEDCILLS